ncbi:MAG TPA: alpha/beta hydrolase [Vicinamibacterales bacterium]|nr:alpha/beta hydrolase [Vicinamibacterales bacterium]
MNRIIYLAATACVALFMPQHSHASSVQDCHVGAYRLADKSIVDIAPSDDDTLRWRRFDGITGLLRKQQDGSWLSTFGWTDRPDGKRVQFSACEAAEIRFGSAAGHRIGFDVTDTTFHSRDVDLAGRLVLPKGKGRVPIVVLVHGAERDSARDFYALQRLLPAEGVGAFVYDKRGTGASQGQYTQDFDVLADDAVAALREARRLAGNRTGRTGYQGGSQGGWIAPLAATRIAVDFVIVSFGLAVSVIDEDQQEVALEMRVKGHSDDEIAKALEVADAAERVIESKFTEGFEHFDAVRAKYRNEPWYKDVHGNYTYLLLPHSEAELREIGKKYVFGTPFRYDPMPTLRAVEAPQLWILGEDDFEAPSAETSRRLKTLIDEGRPITLALYPHVEHGMTEYELKPDGERVSTRYAAGYFTMMRDFAATGRLHGPYGSSVITSARDKQ